MPDTPLLLDPDAVRALLYLRRKGYSTEAVVAAFEGITPPHEPAFLRWRDVPERGPIRVLITPQERILQGGTLAAYPHGQDEPIDVPAVVRRRTFGVSGPEAEVLLDGESEGRWVFNLRRLRRAP